MCCDLVCICEITCVLDHCAEIHNLEWKDVHEIDEALFFKISTAHKHFEIQGASIY